jgi:hypothetical protein
MSTAAVSRMNLYVRQTQFPVGQGGVHLAQLRTSAKLHRSSRAKPVSIMFDCGGIGNPSALSRSLSTVRLALPVRAGRRNLDLLVLSHLHCDHIKGFLQFVQGVPLSIDRLIIPHYDDEDRLVLLAQVAAQTADIDLVIQTDQITANPGQWFGDRGVAQVIQIRPGGGDPTAGPTGGPLSPEPKAPEEEGGDRSASPSIVLNDHQRRSLPLDGNHHVVENGAMAQVAVNASRSGAQVLTDWIALPYCLRTAPGQGGHRDKAQFVGEVKVELANYRNVAGMLEVKPGQAANILTKLKDSFRSYVGSQHSTWNALSLSLFNGLQRKRSLHAYVSIDRSTTAFVEKSHFSLLAPFVFPRPPIYMGTRGGHAWVHTGDSDLMNRTADWCAFYKAHYESCSIFQLPHHGSDNNFATTFSLAPALIAFATCRSSSRHHPGPFVVSAVRGQNVEFHSVTEDPQSVLQSFAAVKI